MKKFVSVLLILSLMLSVFTGCGNEEAAAVTEEAPAEVVSAEEPQTASEETQAPTEQPVSSGYYQVGDKIDDFTVTTHDGREVSLYKVLEEKNMVLLNLWATWCGPCGIEFPAMQEAYEQYQDKVEIIALSEEATDSDEVLTQYVQEKGMTFCVGRDTVGLGSRIRHEGIPTSIVVDRFGTICLIEEGAMPYSEIFTHLFAIYTAEDYTQPVFLPRMLSEEPSAQPADPAQLNEALNAEGGTLEFDNAANPFYWPMAVVQKDGRTVVTATNVASAYSKGVVEAQVDVQAGDVLVMEYKLQSEFYTNIMCVEVDGSSVKKTSRSQDWTTYAYRFEESGSHVVSICFETDWQEGAADDGLWIDSIRVVSGDEAVQALEANPKYPVGEEIRIQVLNENNTKVCLYNETDPSVKEVMYFCPDATVQLLITLDDTVDPESVYLENVLTGENMPLANFADEEGFLLAFTNATEEQQLTAANLNCDGAPVDFIYICPSEEACNQYLDMFNTSYGESYVWEYWDDSMEAVKVTGDVTYTVTYIDQNGDPVPGVMCQVCDESMCQVFTSDADGICRFTLPAKNYEIHTLMVPGGYEGDTTTITKAPAQGGELTFTLTKK